jgi:uncharacterized protein (DUF488 family)
VLNRQTVILQMLQLADRPVSKLELMKWAFVLSRETTTRGGDSFYEFLPYHFGPYSFSLQRDMESFTNDGLLTDDGKHWILTKQSVTGIVSRAIQRDASRIVDRFRRWSLDDVIGYVYRTYPAYTVNSKRERLAVRAIASPAIYTSGYEGLQIDGFLDRLVQSGIQRLVDVRNNPTARRYGFHKSTLQRLCGNLEIDYVHFPELGIVSAERKPLIDQGDYDTLFDRYERITLPSQTAAINQVGKLVKEKPSVLVCMEAEACRCHRSRLANVVADRTGLKVMHLGESNDKC